MKNVIFMSFLLCIIGMTFTGCAPKSNNEISDMAMQCFEKHQGIIIKFEPQPENKELQHID